MIGTDIGHAAALLKRGALVGIPTETVYGLAGNALDGAAVSAIFAVKNRPTFDPLIVHIHHWEQAAKWVTNIPPAAELLATAFLPGPLTLLLDRKALIPDLVTAGSPLVAIRIPKHPMALALLEQLDFPLAAPSANPFGYISPTTAQHVETQLGGKIPYILDGGPCAVGLESTIVGFDPDTDQGIVYRKGGTPVEAIEHLIGPVQVQAHSSSNPLAPGMLKSHYAPRVKILLGEIPSLLSQYEKQRVGILAFQHYSPGVDKAHQVVLSPSGDLQEAARKLFGALRYLDNLQIDIILAELVPEYELGRAINDRLKRAAAE